MKVNQLMTNQPVTIAPDTKVSEAAKLMQSHDIGSIPVCSESGDLMGIITDRDIVVRSIAQGLDPNESEASTVMTTNVVTVEGNTDVHCAAKIMSEDKIRRIPVVSDNKVIGMLALGDIATSDDLFIESAEALCDISQGCKC